MRTLSVKMNFSQAINDVIECLSVLSLHGGLPKGKGLTKLSELIELLFMDHHQVIFNNLS